MEAAHINNQTVVVNKLAGNEVESIFKVDTMTEDDLGLYSCKTDYVKFPKSMEYTEQDVLENIID